MLQKDLEYWVIGGQQAQATKDMSDKLEYLLLCLIQVIGSVLVRLPKLKVAATITRRKHPRDERLESLSYGTRCPPDRGKIKT